MNKSVSSVANALRVLSKTFLFAAAGTAVAALVPAVPVAAASTSTDYRESSESVTNSKSSSVSYSASAAGVDCYEVGLILGYTEDDYDEDKDAFLYSTTTSRDYYYNFTYVFGLSGTAEFVNNGTVTFVANNNSTVYGDDYYVYGRSVAVLSDSASFTNAGTLKDSGIVYLYLQDSSSLTNSGTVDCAGVYVNGSATFTNSRYVYSDVYVSDSATFTNSGTVGDYSEVYVSGNASFINAAGGTVSYGDVTAESTATVTLYQGSRIGNSSYYDLTLGVAGTDSSGASVVADEAVLNIVLTGDDDTTLIGGDLVLYTATSLNVSIDADTDAAAAYVVHLFGVVVSYKTQTLYDANGEKTGTTTGSFVTTTGTFEIDDGTSYTWVLNTDTGFLIAYSKEAGTVDYRQSSDTKTISSDDSVLYTASESGVDAETVEELIGLSDRTYVFGLSGDAEFVNEGTILLLSNDEGTSEDGCGSVAVLSDTATFTNEGIVYGFGIGLYLTGEASFTNNSDGTVVTDEIHVLEDATFTNEGYVYSGGVYVGDSATFTNSSYVYSDVYVSDSAAFTNSGTVYYYSDVYVSDSATFTNSGRVYDVYVSDSATFTNSGAVYSYSDVYVSDSATFTNSGAVYSYSDVYVSDSATFTNSGTVDSYSEVYISDSATFTNSGTVDSYSEVYVSDSATFTNSGTVYWSDVYVSGNASFINAAGGTVSYGDVTAESTATVTLYQGSRIGPSSYDMTLGVAGTDSSGASVVADEAVLNIVLTGDGDTTLIAGDLVLYTATSLNVSIDADTDAADACIVHLFGGDVSYKTQTLYDAAGATTGTTTGLFVATTGTFEIDGGTSYAWVLNTDTGFLIAYSEDAGTVVDYRQSSGTKTISSDDSVLYTASESGVDAETVEELIGLSDRTYVFGLSGDAEFVNEGTILLLSNDDGTSEDGCGSVAVFSDTATFTNAGMTYGYGIGLYVIDEASFTNSSGETVVTDEIHVLDDATFTNEGYVYSDGVYVGDSATFTNSKTVRYGDVYVSDSATFTNSGYVYSDVYVSDSAAFTNSGTVYYYSDVYVSDSATFTNSGYVYSDVYVSDSATFTNSSYVYSDVYVSDSAAFTNSGTVYYYGDVYVSDSATFTNSGTVDEGDVYVSGNASFINAAGGTVYWGDVTAESTATVTLYQGSRIGTSSYSYDLTLGVAGTDSSGASVVADEAVLNIVLTSDGDTTLIGGDLVLYTATSLNVSIDEDSEAADSYTVQIYAGDLVLGTQTLYDANGEETGTTTGSLVTTGTFEINDGTSYTWVLNTDTGFLIAYSEDAGTVVDYRQSSDTETISSDDSVLYTASESGVDAETVEELIGLSGRTYVFGLSGDAEFVNEGTIWLVSNDDGTSEDGCGSVAVLSDTATFTNEGIVYGYGIGLYLTDEASFTNSSGETVVTDEIHVLDDATFTNSGYVYSGGIYVGDSATFTNSGIVDEGDVYVSDSATFTNSGTVYDVYVSDSATFTNSGTVDESDVYVSGNASFINAAGGTVYHGDVTAESTATVTLYQGSCITGTLYDLTLGVAGTDSSGASVVADESVLNIVLTGDGDTTLIGDDLVLYTATSLNVSIDADTDAADAYIVHLFGGDVSYKTQTLYDANGEKTGTTTGSFVATTGTFEIDDGTSYTWVLNTDTGFLIAYSKEAGTVNYRQSSDTKTISSDDSVLYTASESGVDAETVEELIGLSGRTYVFGLSGDAEFVNEGTILLLSNDDGTSEDGCGSVAVLSDTATFTNEGMTYGYGIGLYVVDEASFTNSSGETVVTDEIHVLGNAKFTNKGYVYSDGVYVGDSATFTNSGAVYSYSDVYVSDSATFTNSSYVYSDVYVSDSATFTNSSYVYSDVYVSDGAAFTNSGDVYSDVYVSDSATFTNSGTVHFSDVYVSGNASFINAEGGTVYYGDVTAESTATVTLYQGSRIGTSSYHDLTLGVAGTDSSGTSVVASEAVLNIVLTGNGDTTLIAGDLVLYTATSLNVSIDEDSEAADSYTVQVYAGDLVLGTQTLYDANGEETGTTTGSLVATTGTFTFDDTNYTWVFDTETGTLTAYITETDDSDDSADSDEGSSGDSDSGSTDDTEEGSTDDTEEGSTDDTEEGSSDDTDEGSGFEDSDGEPQVIVITDDAEIAGFDSDDDVSFSQTLESFAGTISSSDSDSVVTSSADLEFSGDISDYAGTVDIASGTFTITSDASLGSSAAFDVSDDATLELAFDTDETTTFRNATSGAGTLLISSGTVAFSKSVGVKTLSVADDATLSGDVSLTNSNGATLNLAGTLVLNVAVPEKVSSSGALFVELSSASSLDLVNGRRVLLSGETVTIFSSESGELEITAADESSGTATRGASSSATSVIKSFLLSDDDISALADETAVVYDVSDSALTVRIDDTSVTVAELITESVAVPDGLHDGLSALYSSIVSQILALDEIVDGFDAEDEIELVSAGLYSDDEYEEEYAEAYADALEEIELSSELVASLGSVSAGEIETLSPLSYAAMIAVPVAAFQDDIQSISSRLAARRFEAFDPHERWQFYVQAQYMAVENDDADDTAVFDYDLAGILAGADCRVAETLTLGLAVAASSGDADMHHSGGKIEIDDYRITGYLSLLIAETFAIDFGTQFGMSDYDVKRKSSLLGSIDGDTDGMSVGAFISAGTLIVLSEENRIFAEPYVGLNVLYTSVDGFTEERGGLFDIDDFDETTIAASVGCNFSWQLAVAGTQSRLGFGVAYTHEFVDDVDIDAKLRYLDGTKYKVEADMLSSDRFSLGPTLEVGLTESVGIYAGYTFSFGTDSATSHSANVGVRVSF